MKSKQICIATIALISSMQLILAYNLQYIGNFTVSHPGFLSLIRTQDTGRINDDYSLFVSSFNGAPFTTDHVYFIPAIGTVVQTFQSNGHHTVKHTTLSSNIVWPNEVNQVPDDVFGKKMMSIAGGFLVPLKTKGSIRLVDLSTGTPQRPTEITTGSDDHHWFYHRVLWLDMNGDGKKDAVTCRAKKSLLGSGTGQLVWYEHPQTDSISNPWHHFIIADHSDTFFDITTLTTPAGTNTVIVTTGFFSNQLKIYWTTDPAGKWTDTLKIKSRVIEEHIGHVFDVQIDDVNNDGKSDLLVTSNGLSNTAVYVYEIPADFRTQTFTRHTIMTGFKSHNLLPGGGAPGSAKTIRNPSINNGKPLILLSGDDDSHAYILNADSESVSNWSYHSKKILDTKGGTVGGITSHDIDGDGHLEIFVPAYSNNLIHIFKLLP
ncbi:uncharacterized protein LOC134691412 [Mytilus trossulus]|uniref:uncharacterized protein LOC134691412 n=1 Tax=Mytilus trossulus TaxID=6551 RepID=UPI0030060301